MTSYNFYLKEPNSQNTTLINLMFSYDGKRLKFSTGEKINPKAWNSLKQTVRPSYTNSVEINLRLKTIRDNVEKIYTKFFTEGKNLPVETLREELKKSLHQDQRSIATFFSVFDEFVEITRCSVKLKTTSKYLALRTHLKGYEAKYNQKITFDNITPSFYEKLLAFFTQDRSLSNNTIGKYITTLKVFMNWSTKREFNKNLAYMEFKSPNEEADIIYLEQAELDALYNYDFSENKRLERVRDIFCLSCYTGLRYSDVIKIKQDDIIEGSLMVKTFKTKETLKIPITNNAQVLLKKNLSLTGYISNISNQKMNEYIKQACAAAGIVKKTTLTRYIGSKPIKRTLPKCDLVSTHTARRTFITLSLEKGMRPELLMKITGHKDYKTLKKYIKLTDKVVDKEMRNIWDNDTEPFLTIAK